MILCFVKIETNGLDPIKHDLYHISAKLYDKDVLVDSFEDFAYCRSEPSYYCSQALGLNEHTLKSYPKDTFDRFQRFISRQEKVLLVGYNASFDRPFIQEWFKDNQSKYTNYFLPGQVCLMSMSSTLLQNHLHKLPNFTKETVYKLFDIHNEKPIEANIKLYYKLIKNFQIYV